jgi:hypothetical protein
MTLDEEDALAERAAAGDPSARRELWVYREPNAHAIALGKASDMGMSHHAEGAKGQARRTFILETIPTYDRGRGHFWPDFASWIIRKRVGRWLKGERRHEGQEGTEDPNPDDGRKSALDTPPGEWDEDRDNQDRGDRFDDVDVAGLRAMADAIEDRSQRLKWTVFVSLSTFYEIREIADALALDAAGAEVGETLRSIGATWEIGAPRLRELRIPGRPPPAPRTWGGCVALFCPSLPDGSAPRPPNLDRVRDEATREAELAAWYERVRRHFRPDRVEMRRRWS